MMKVRRESLLKLRTLSNIKENTQRRMKMGVERLLTAQKERNQMKRALKYKPVLSLLASLAFCIPAGAQNIAGAVFGGGQNADVEGSTFVAVNPNPVSDPMGAHGTAVFNHSITWDGTDMSVWTKCLDNNGNYNYKLCGPLYQNGSELKLQYTNGTGGNALDLKTLPAGKYSFIGRLENPSVVSVDGAFYCAVSVTGNAANNWKSYTMKDKTNIYDYNTYGPLFVDGKKLTSVTYVDGEGVNCLNVTTLDSKTTYSLLADVVCVVGGGENGNVTGNTIVEINDGVFGHEDEDLKKNVGKILGGGLYGTVGSRSEEVTAPLYPATIPDVYRKDYENLKQKTHYPNYTSVLVDGNNVDVYGETFAGGYGGDVLGSTFLTLNHGYLNCVYGGGVEADVMGRSHVMISEKLSTTSSVHVSRFNKDKYENARVDDQADLKIVDQMDAEHVYTGNNVAAVGAPILVIGGSVYGGGAYGNVGTSLTEADVKEMAASTITMNAGYLGYIPGLAAHHANYVYNEAVETYCVNPFTLYENEYDITSGCIFGGGYGGSTVVPSTKITVNSGFISGTVYGGGEKGDIGLVQVAASDLKSVNLNDSMVADGYRRCKGNGDIDEIPVGTVPTADDGYTYFKKIFEDPFADTSNASQIEFYGNSQYMIQYQDERVNGNYHETRIDGTRIFQKAQGLMVEPRNTAEAGDVKIENPTPFQCGFNSETFGGYYIYDPKSKNYVYVYSEKDGWQKNISWNGGTYDADLFKLTGRDGTADQTLSPADYYNLSSVLSVAGGGFDGDCFGNTNIKIEGGSYGMVIENEKKFMGEVIGGCYNGFVNGSTNISIGGYSDIWGDVYGGGVNGNVDGNTKVDMSSGFVRNIYGGGMFASVGWYKHLTDERHGNTYVSLVPNGAIDPHTQKYDRIFVAQSVYGGGAFDLVRKDTHVKITGGRIGYFPDYDTHTAAYLDDEAEEVNYYTEGEIKENTYNDNEGNVFGAGLGNTSSVLDNTYVDVVSEDEKNTVYVLGSVYGGGMQGCVGMGFVDVYYIEDQSTFDYARNFVNNANPGHIYKFIQGDTYARGLNGYVDAGDTYQEGVQYFMAVKHVENGSGLQEWGDKYGNTNVNVAANVRSNVDGKVWIGGSVVGGSRGYNTTYEGNTQYTKVDAMYLGFVLNDTKVKIGSGGEKSEKSIEIHGLVDYDFKVDADSLSRLANPTLSIDGEYVGYYFQNRASIFFPLFQNDLVEYEKYYTKSGEGEYQLVNKPTKEDLVAGKYYMTNYYKDYIQINPDTTTAEATKAAIQAMTEEGGVSHAVRLYVLESITSVVGGGECGHVIGDTDVEVTNGTMGYQNENEFRMMGDVIGGGLNGDVMGYTRLKVDGEFVYILGECYGGGLKGIVRNTTKSVKEVLETGMLDPNEPKQKDEVATELLFQKGMARDVFGGNCYENVLRGNTHLQIGDKPGEGEKASPDRLAVIAQSAYGGCCFAGVNGESKLDMYNGIVGYTRARPIIYYNEKDTLGSHNDDLVKDTWLTQDNSGNETDNYGKANYWWWKDYREGNVFGAGYGAESRSMRSSVNIYGGRIRNSVYGGGELGDVGGDFSKSATGAGNANTGEYLSTEGADLSAGHYTLYNKVGSSVYSKNEKGTYYRPIVSTVNIQGGLIGDCVFGGGKGEENGEYSDVFGSTKVNITGGEWIYRLILNDKSKDPYLCNIFAGTRIKGNVFGDTFLNIEKTMCGTGIVNNDGGAVWRTAYNKWYGSKMSAFGGGYGKDTQVRGNTNVYMNVKDFDKSVEVTAATAANMLSPYPYQTLKDLVGGGYEGKVLGSTYVTVEGKSFVRNVYGGGFFESIGTPKGIGQTRYTTSTNVLLKQGSFSEVYGGGFLSDVHGETSVDYGEYGKDNDKLFVRMNLYGGTNVSGNIAASDNVDYGSRVNIYGGTIGNEKGYVYMNRSDLGRDFNVHQLYYKTTSTNASTAADDVYLPVCHNGEYDESLFDRKVTTLTNKEGEVVSDTVYTIKDDAHAKIEMYEQVKVGNVYGSGNGDYPGFYEDGLLAEETGHTYLGKKRPNVASSKINIVGSEGHIVTINGGVFGGGNAATVGFFKVKPFTPGTGTETVLNWYPDYEIDQTKRGSVQVNIGGYAKIKDLFMGSNGECLINNLAYHVYKVSKYEDKQLVSSKKYPGFLTKEDYERYVNQASMNCVPQLTFNKPDENGKGVFDKEQSEDKKNKAEHITIGSFFGGGNVGSMFADTTYEYSFPAGVTIVDRIVGGSNRTNFKYTQFYSASEEGVTAEPVGTVFNHVGGFITKNTEENTPKVKLDIRCKFAPNCKEVEDDRGNRYFDFEGSMVYGGCYNSGLINGDVEIYTNSDYVGDKYTASQYIETADFIPIVKKLLASAKDFDQQFGTVFGGGYGSDTRVTGNTTIEVRADKEKKIYPVLNRIFGGGDNGVVEGNTKVIFDASTYGCAYGKVYGGGSVGYVGGDTEVEIYSGLLAGDTYGGARMADVGGTSYVKVEDTDDEGNVLMETLYGGCDISGEVKGTKEFTTHDGDKVTVNSFVSISENDSKGDGYTGFPFIGQVYGGCDGHYSPTKNGYYTEDFKNELYGNELKLKGTAIPKAAKTYIDITGGTMGYVFAGGNNVTVDGEVNINFDNQTQMVASFKDDYLRQLFLYLMENHTQLYTGYEDKNGTIVMNNQVANMFGGNNLTAMFIQPKWKLTSGTIGNLYSGGNRGAMHYYDETQNNESATGTPGIELTINSDDIFVDNVYGGCRMADVKPYKIEKSIVTAETFQKLLEEGRLMEKIGDMYRMTTSLEFDATKDYYEFEIVDDKIPSFVENKYGAVLNIKAGNFEHVYGGNDVSGLIYEGTYVNVSGAVSGNVYGAGNGNYLYQCDKTVTEIVEVEHPEDKNLPELYFKIPFTGESDAEKIAAVNAARPNVSKSYLKVEGAQEGKPAYVKGNIFCGGNSATILSNEQEEASTLFDIGNDVTINGVYLGSDGLDLTDGSMMTTFKMLNDIKTFSTTLSDSDIKRYELEDYQTPTLLTLYMKAVETKALPKGFGLKEDLHRANIGTFCCGGNRGSVSAPEPINITFPKSLNIFTQIIAGCNDADVTYDGVTHIGGFVAENRGEDVGKDKIHFTLKNHFIPRLMSVEKGSVENNYLIDATMTEEEYKNQTSTMGKSGDEGEKVYPAICNVYGGCYMSGAIYGKVSIDVESNLLEHVDLNILDRSNKNEIAAFSVFGGGYGAKSWNLGGAQLNMRCNDEVKSQMSESAPIKVAPAVNNLFGGGQLGSLIGNATLNVTSGEVYNNLIGGSLAGYIYGSTQLLVGYPQYYICNTTGEYQMKRGDTSAENLALENKSVVRDLLTGQNKEVIEKVIRQSVRYVKGDLVPANIYEMIVDKDATKASCFNLQENAHEWTDDDYIFVRKGVYGGGYARASGGNVYAGSYTVCKYIDQYNLTALNKQGGTEEANIGYGGNTSIMVSDDRSSDSQKDHITISSEIHREVKLTAEDDLLGYYKINNDAVSINKYQHLPTGKPETGTTYYTFEGEGGVYGDGRMVFAEGIRAVDIYNYGYAQYTAQYPKLLNTFQRCDVVSLTDCCLQLQGAKDFATNSVDATTYSVTRVNELRMNSTIDANNEPLQRHDGNNDVLDKLKARNYMGLFNNIHYLGSLISNASFDDKWHPADGHVSDSTYRQYKEKYIEDYIKIKDDDNADKGQVYENFKKRNVGMAKNLIGINNGYCLKIQNCYTTLDERQKIIDHIYYGPVGGVVEVRLLTLIPGEGGGYIYADNVHDETNPTFLNVSGNFVFPGMAHTAGIAPQHIVDDCFPLGFYNNRGVNAPKDEEVHYWYVEGNLYFYNTTITGYTYTPPTGEKKLNFDLNNVDQLITLSGTSPNPNKLIVKSVRWHSNHDESDGYACDLEDFTNKTGYKLMMSVSDINTYDAQQVNEGKACYFESIPRQSNIHAYDLTKDKIDGGESDYVGSFQKTDQINMYSPLLAIRLEDTERNGGREYYEKHMNQPDLIQLVLQSEVHDPDYPDDPDKTLVYTYVINLTIRYVLGPDIKGTIHVKNCALPGEIIHVTKEDVTIDADETMPVTNTYWKILPKLDEDTWTDREGGLYVYQYVNSNTGNLELPAKYMYNDWKVEYYVETSNYEFPVEAPEGDHLIVHNYHRMQKVASFDKDGNMKPELDVIPGSRIYIQDKTDLERFRMYVDYCKDKQEDLEYELTEGHSTWTKHYIVNPNNCEGLKFYFQNNIVADSWTNPTNEFKGELNGDGASLQIGTLDGTSTNSLLAKNSGEVYNIGVVGGSIATENANLLMNSFSYGADVAQSNSGTVTNCYQNMKSTGSIGIYAANDKFNDATVAYNLNKFYLDKRFSLKGNPDNEVVYEKKSNPETSKPERYYKTDNSDYAAYKYVYDYYKNGDYRYAKVRGKNSDGSNDEYLRSAPIPNYDNGDKTYSSHHYLNLKADPRRARFEAADGTLQKDSTATFVLNEPVYPDDYIFFGQKLIYGHSQDHDIYPRQINLSVDDDVNNRVYRVSGFYGSKQDQGVHFNHQALLDNVLLTAVDFTCQRDKENNNAYIQGYPTDEALKAKYNVFYPPTMDYDGIKAFSIINKEVTPNMLIYTSNDQNTTEYKYVDEANRLTDEGLSVIKYDLITDEDLVLAHHIIIDTDATTASAAKASAARGWLHLVDKQNFNCPIEFGVADRAWYSRKPDCLNEGHNDGWESICLPFTVKKVTATQVDNLPADHVNYFNHGEITHFYGTEADKKNYDTEAPTDVTKFNTDQNQVGHEYWLRGFTNYDNAKNLLTFMRPTPKDGGGFYDERMGGTNGSKFEYVYDNKYLSTVTNSQNAYSYYADSHTYKDYMPLTANVPYIVSYPGTYFYEFSMKGEDITYENSNVTIAVTDNEKQMSECNGYEFYGTFKKLTPTAEKPYYFSGSEAKKDYAGDCFMLSDVNQTDRNGNVLGTIYPFRCYFNVTKSSNAQKYLPFSLKRFNKDEQTSPADEIGALKIWTEGRTLCVNSPEDMILKLYSVSGILMKNLDVKKGSNRFPVEMPGVYVVNNNKYKLQ